MKKFKQGFSLIEVMIVLGILALLASMIVPIVQSNRDKAAYEVSVMNLNQVSKAMEKHYLEKGRYPVFKNWSEVSADDTPLLEYLNDIPTEDAWNRPYRVVTSTETEYTFEGLSIKGKLATEFPDYTYSTDNRFKQKGKNN